ncbi:MAG: CotH kinase family protein [Eubacterium sp.]|nr:CotH kinase family protein [Eubacterium sp.]
MKKSKKIISIILTLVLSTSAFFAVPMTSSAVSKAGDLESAGLEFWADPENSLTVSDINAFIGNQSKTTMTGAVGVYKRSTSSDYYYLFLPSNADCSNLKVWFTAASASVNGKTVESGKNTDVFKDIDEGGFKKDYTLKLNSTSYNLVAIKSGDVGTIYVDTESGSIKSINGSSDHSVSEAGSVLVINPQGEVEYDGDMESFKGRGNATWSTGSTKNPYGLKLAQSTSLMGLGKGKKWVLLANSNDSNSLLKNQIIYDFSKYIGINYQPTCHPVDLYVNQQYYGSYQLCEKVEIKSARVDINDSYEALEIANGTSDPQTGAITPADFSTMSNFTTRVFNADGSRNTNSASGANSYAHTVGTRKVSGTTSGLSFNDLNDPIDITGGYVFEMEISNRWANETTGFCAYNRQGWVVKSHDYVSRNMANYCYDLLYALGSAIYNGGTVPSTSTTTTCSSLSNLSVISYGAKSVTNPAPAEQYQGKRWSDIMDADSATRNYWIQEFFKNIDASITSNYFYKDSDSFDSKLYAGPAWDFDNALEYDRSGQYRWGMNRSDTSGWYAKNSRIYSWREGDHSTAYTSNNQAPLGFYAALATNCSDFDLMAKSEWYSNVAPAIDVLLGNKTDPNGVLKSTAEYADAIKKTGTMNNIRHDKNSSNEYDVSSVTNGINNWVSERRTWINNEFGTVSISNCTVDAIDEQSVTGREIKPEVKVSYKGVELKKGKDYSVSYSNNISSGTANVVVSGMGYYSGERTEHFTIKAGSLIGTSVTIREGAYKDEVLIPRIIDKENVEINDFINYQWYSDDTAISGATDREYTVKASDAGKTLTLKITGDGVNLDELTITSNPCTVYAGEKPENYTETLASWDYDYISDTSNLVNADESGETYYYNATSGMNAQSAKLRGSVNATDSSKIKWSGIGEEYKNGSPSGKAQVPLMGTSKSDNIAWGEYPYFEASVSTKQYENITFSAKLGGTKKGPRDWKLQYSVDGKTFKDVSSATYSLTANKDMQQAFNNVQLPDECDDRNLVYIRAIVNGDIAINGINAIIGELSGDAAINNVQITGAKITAITQLDAPEISSNTTFEDNSLVFDTDSVSIKDTNGGAEVYYSVDGSEFELYKGKFNPFSESAKAGDKAVVKAYSYFNEIYSETVRTTFTYAGDNINQFSFDSFSENVYEGKVFSNGGAFGKSARMSAYADGQNLYVPLWNDEKKAFSIAPDDGAKWSEYSGFTFELSTAGYKNIRLSMKAYTTNLGPLSVSLDYSLNGNDWHNIVQYADLYANGNLNQLFSKELLPEECDNKTKVYLRIRTEENETFSHEVLHNNQSKGNLYINDVFFSGDENSDIKMPYTNKTSDYFGDSGTIKYYSVDDYPMFYTVSDTTGKTILSGRYSESGISITSASAFSKLQTGGYKVSVRAGDDDDSSATNVRTYYYKGSSIAEFDFDGKNTLIEDYLDAESTTVSNSGGSVASTLSFYPNAADKTAFSYGDKYGIKSSYTVENPFVATKNLDNPSGNGYYLIKTNTKGYHSITLGAEQICSNKAPRDWGIAYSTNGTNYTFVEKSNVRAVSNDAFDSTVETYNNFRLPSQCDDKDELYIKIFINGGEAVDGTELADVTKGNCGINNVEISGVEIPKEVSVTIDTFLLESKDKMNESCPVSSTITINDETVSEHKNSVTLTLIEGEKYTAYISANKTFEKKVTFTAEKDLVLSEGIIALDLDGNGVINAKDYSRIIRITNDAQEKAFEEAFENFINKKSDGFSY